MSLRRTSVWFMSRRCKTRTGQPQRVRTPIVNCRASWPCRLCSCKEREHIAVSVASRDHHAWWLGPLCAADLSDVRVRLCTSSVDSAVQCISAWEVSALLVLESR